MDDCQNGQTSPYKVQKIQDAFGNKFMNLVGWTELELLNDSI